MSGADTQRGGQGRPDERQARGTSGIQSVRDIHSVHGIQPMPFQLTGVSQSGWVFRLPIT